MRGGKNGVSRLFRPGFDPLWLALLHGVLALIFWLNGLRFGEIRIGGNWGDLWQGIPKEDLLARPWESLWLMHAQPPLYSLWAWIWLRMLPGHFPDSLQATYVAMGMVTVALAADLGRRQLGGRKWTLALGLLVALNPAIFYFEGHLLYEMMVIMLVSAAAWTLARTLATARPAWLFGYVVVLNLLLLTRSFYHLAFMAVALLFPWRAWRRLSRPALVAGLALSMAAPAAWYAKNYAQYGFFGGSSWFGFGFYRCALEGFTLTELKEIAARGEIPNFVAEMWPYEHEVSAYREFGFDAESPVPLLSRNDWHNINVPAIGQAYADASATLVRRYPGHYLRALHRAYMQFSLAPTRFSHLVVHREAHVPWELLYGDVLYGAYLADTSELFFRFHFGSMFYFAYPLLLAGMAGLALRRAGRNRALLARGACPTERARVLPLLLAWLLFVSIYVTAVGTMFEFGENVRFRYALEPLHFMAGLLIVKAGWRRWGRPGARRRHAGRAAAHRLRAR